MQELLKIQRLVRGNKKLFACLIGLQILYKPPLKYLRFGWGMARLMKMLEIMTIKVYMIINVD